jgi:hypothetical protein
LQNGECQHGSHNVHRGGAIQHRQPVAGGIAQHAAERYQQSGSALGGIEQAVIGGGEAAAEGIAAGGGEQGINLAPSKEHHAGEHHERHRVIGQRDQRKNPKSLQQKRDEHRDLAADMVGHPAEERSRQSVQDAVEREREGQCRQCDEQQGHRRFGDAEIGRDHRQLCGCDQPARAHQHEHRVHHPEHRLARHLARAIVTGDVVQARRARGRHAARCHRIDMRATLAWWRPQREPHQHHHDALQQAEHQEGRLVAAGRDHI